MEVSMTPSTALVPAEAQAFTPDLGRYRKWFTAYETNKSDEIQEQLVHEAYYNSTGRPIVLKVRCTVTAANNYPVITVTQNGSAVEAACGSSAAATNNSCATAVIPPGASYSWTISGGGTAVSATELR